MHELSEVSSPYYPRLLKGQDILRRLVATEMSGHGEKSDAETRLGTET